MTNPKTPEALAAARRAAKAFAERHLSTLAAEIIEWQDTAVLRDGKMRELGSICSALDDDHSLQLAESFVSRAALAALAKPQAEPVAEGFVLVPLESTHKMDLAGEEAWENSGHPAPSVASIYKAMLSARPVAQTATKDLGVPPSESGSSLQPSASTAIPNAVWMPPASILKCDKCGGPITGTAFGEIDASGSRFYHPHCKPPTRGIEADARRAGAESPVATATRPEHPSQPSEPAQPVAAEAVEDMLNDLVRKASTLGVTHNQYMGKAMSDEVYDRFATLRDDTIPALKGKLLAALASPPAQPSTQAGEVVATLDITINNDDPEQVYLLKQYARNLQDRVANQRREIARLSAALPAAPQAGEVVAPTDELLLKYLGAYLPPSPEPDDITDLRANVMALYAALPAAPVAVEGVTAWHFEVEGDTAKVCSPLSGPGMLVVAEQDRPLANRLLFALAKVLSASLPVQPTTQPQGGSDADR